MPFAKTSYGNIFYTLNEPGQEHTLILIHGSGGDHTHWHENLRNLSGVSVYAIDLPGHGKSDGRSCHQVNDYADVINDFVTKLNLTCVTLAGHSLGGAIVQTLALRSPTWLSRIILVGTGARLRVTSAILDELLSDFEKTVDIMCEYAFGLTASEAMIYAGKEAFLNTSPKVIHDDFSACNQFDIMEKVNEISFPALIISGTADRLTPVKYGEYLCSRISGSKHAVIKDAGHMMGLEKSEEFVECITEFLFKG